MYYAYILECADGSLYTGWTDDVTKRVKAHNSGVGSRYTRARLPVVPRYSEAFDTKSEAMRRECAIKKLDRGQKLALIQKAESNKIEPNEGAECPKNDSQRVF